MLGFLNVFRRKTSPSSHQISNQLEPAELMILAQKDFLLAAEKNRTWASLSDGQIPNGVGKIVVISTAHSLIVAAKDDNSFAVQSSNVRGHLIVQVSFLPDKVVAYFGYNNEKTVPLSQAENLTKEVAGYIETFSLYGK